MNQRRDRKEWDRCHCPCHRNDDIKHVRACCDGGWIRIYGQKSAEPLPGQLDLFAGATEGPQS